MNQPYRLFVISYDRFSLGLWSYFQVNTQLTVASGIWGGEMAARPLQFQPGHPLCDMRSDKECVPELLSHLQLLRSKYLNTDSSTRMQVSIQSCKMHKCIVDRSQCEDPWAGGLQHKDRRFPIVTGKIQQGAEPHTAAHSPAPSGTRGRIGKAEGRKCVGW